MGKNVYQNNKTSVAADNNTKRNKNNIFVYENIDLSNCRSPQEVLKNYKNGYKNININNVQNIGSLKDIIDMIGNGNTPNPTPTRPEPTKPAPTAPEPTKPAPTTPPANTGSNQNFAEGY